MERILIGKSSMSDEERMLLIDAGCQTLLCFTPVNYNNHYMMQRTICLLNTQVDKLY